MGKRSYGRPLSVGGTIVKGQATQVRAEEQRKGSSIASKSSRQPIAECVRERKADLRKGGPAQE